MSFFELRVANHIDQKVPEDKLCQSYFFSSGRTYRNEYVNASQLQF
jgi:hypothetical protein